MILLAIAIPVIFLKVKIDNKISRRVMKMNPEITQALTDFGDNLSEAIANEEEMKHKHGRRNLKAKNHHDFDSTEWASKVKTHDFEMDFKENHNARNTHQNKKSHHEGKVHHSDLGKDITKKFTIVMSILSFICHVAILGTYAFIFEQYVKACVTFHDKNSAYEESFE